jgi:hypothetical protein
LTVIDDRTVVVLRVAVGEVGVVGGLGRVVTLVTTIGTEVEEAVLVGTTTVVMVLVGATTGVVGAEALLLLATDEEVLVLPLLPAS